MARKLKFIVSLVLYEDRNRTQQTIESGIVEAVSAQEALGIFLQDNWNGFGLTSFKAEKINEDEEN